MKKLLIALAAAATTAIGAFAEGWTTGTPFSLESGDPGALGDALVQELTVDPTVAASASGFWTGLTNTVEVKAFNGGAPAPMDRFGSYAHLNYLDVKTAFNAPLFRNAQQNGTKYDFAADGNGNIYFEGNVKFTACDEDPDVSEYTDAKLVMYVKDLSELDEGAAAETNLYVAVGGTTYNCGNAVGVDEWTKLTIKMLKINDSGKAGFVIFLNDLSAPLSPIETIDVPAGLNTVAQSYADKNQLFPASTDDTTIEGIGFAGQGGLDQIAFTTEDLKPDPSIANVTFDTATIATLFVKEGDKDAVQYTGSPAVFEYDPNASYTYWYTAKPGYVSKTTPATLDLSNEGKFSIGAADPAKVTVTVGAVAQQFATFAEAVAAANEAAADAVIKLEEDVAATGAALANTGKTVLDLNGCALTDDFTAGSDLLITNGVEKLGGVMGVITMTAGNLEIYGGYIAKDAYTEEPDTYYESYAMLAYAGQFGFEPTTADAETVSFINLAAGKQANKLSEEPELWEVVDAVKPPFDGGEGTLEKPYLISSVEALQELQTKVAAGDTFADTYFQQTADIDLSTAGAWTGIGNKAGDKYFAGVYDGNGKKIENVTFDPTINTYMGFFFYVKNATLKDLTIESDGYANAPAREDIVPANEYGGAIIVGKAEYSVLSGLTSEGVLGTDAKPLSHNAAGIIADALVNTYIVNCTNKASIVGCYTKVGGIAAFTGPLGGTVTFENCVNEGDVKLVKVEGYSDPGSYGTAGIVGWIGGNGSTKATDKQFVINCVNTGTITAEAGYAGAIVGRTSYYLYGTNNTYQAQYPALGFWDSNSTFGFKYATVNGETATTLNGDDADLALNGSYQIAAAVFKSGATKEPTFEFTEAGTIAFATNLCKTAIEFTGITVADGTGLEIKETAEGGVVTFTAAAKGPVVPVDDDKELNEKGKENVAKVAEVFGGDLDTWAKAVYGDGGKIPAEKLNATTDELIAAAKAFNLPIMTAAVEVTVEAAAEGFSFKIVDGEPINVQAAKLQELIKYTAALENDFGDSAKKVGLTLSEDNKSFNAKFTTPDAAAGFMKVDMTVEK